MPSFPSTIHDVDKEWIASIFDVEPKAISSLEISVPKERRGYGSEIGFLKIQTDQGGIPSNLVVKVLPTDPAAAEAVHRFGSFWREAAFYNCLGPKSPTRTPKLYAAEYEEESGSAIIVLEDCSSMYQIPNQEVGWVEELREIVSTAARLHAHWWKKETELANYESVMRPGERYWQSLARRTCEGWVRWLESPLAEYAPARLKPLCTSLVDKAEWLMTEGWPKTDLTLCHGDLNGGNLFHDPEKPQDPIVVFDWTSYRLGRGAHDIAYLFSQLPIEFRRQEEEDLLTHYHKGLIQSGVPCSLEQTMLDYRFGCLLNMILMVPMTLDFDFADKEGMLQRTFSIALDHGADVILSELPF